MWRTWNFCVVRFSKLCHTWRRPQQEKQNALTKSFKDWCAGNLILLYLRIPGQDPWKSLSQDFCLFSHEYFRGSYAAWQQFSKHQKLPPTLWVSLAPQVDKGVAVHMQSLHLHYSHILSARRVFVCDKRLGVVTALLDYEKWQVITKQEQKIEGKWNWQITPRRCLRCNFSAKADVLFACSGVDFISGVDHLHKKFACALHTCSACFHMVVSLCACIYIVYYTHGCTFVPWPAIVLIFGQLCSRSAFVPKLMYV